MILGKLVLNVALLNAGVKLEQKTEERIISNLQKVSAQKIYLMEPAAREVMEYLVRASKSGKNHKVERVNSLMQLFTVGKVSGTVSQAEALVSAAKNMHHVGLFLGAAQGQIEWLHNAKNLNSLLHFLQLDLKLSKETYSVYRPWYFASVLKEFFGGGCGEETTRSKGETKELQWKTAEVAAKKLFETVTKALETTAGACSSEAGEDGRDDDETSKNNKGPKKHHGGGKKNKNNKEHGGREQWAHTSGNHGIKKGLELLRICVEVLPRAKFGAAALPALFSSVLVRVFCTALTHNKHKQTANALLQELRKAMLTDDKSFLVAHCDKLRDRLFFEAYENLSHTSREYQRMPSRLQRALSSLLLHRLSGEKLHIVASKLLLAEEKTTTTSTSSATSTSSSRSTSSSKQEDHHDLVGPEALSSLTAHPRCSRHIHKAVLATFLVHVVDVKRYPAAHLEDLRKRVEENLASTTLAKAIAKKITTTTSCAGGKKTSKSTTTAGEQEDAQGRKLWRAQFWKLLGQVLKKASSKEAGFDILSLVYLFAPPASCRVLVKKAVEDGENAVADAEKMKGAADDLTKRVQELLSVHATTSTSATTSGKNSPSTSAVLQLLLAIECVRSIDDDLDNEKTNEILENLLEKVKILDTTTSTTKKKNKKSKSPEDSSSSTSSCKQILVDVEALTEDLPHIYADTVGFVKDAVAECWAAILPELFQNKSDAEVKQGIDNEEVADEGMAAMFEEQLKYARGAAVAQSPAMQVLLGLCLTLCESGAEETGAGGAAEDEEGEDGSDMEENVDMLGEGGAEDKKKGAEDDEDDEKSESEDEDDEMNGGDEKKATTSGAPEQVVGHVVHNSFNEIAVADSDALMTILTEEDANDEMSKLAQSFGVNPSNKTDPSKPTSSADRKVEALKTRMGTLVKQIKYLDLVAEFLDQQGAATTNTTSNTTTSTSSSSSSRGSSSKKESSEQQQQQGQASPTNSSSTTNTAAFAIDILHQLFDGLVVANKRSAKVATQTKGQEKCVTSEATTKLRDIVRKHCEKLLRKASPEVRRKFGAQVVQTCAHMKLKLSHLFEAGAAAAVAALATNGIVDQSVLQNTLEQWLKKDDTKWGPTFMKAVADRYPKSFLHVNWMALLEKEGKAFCKNEIRSFLVHLIQRNRDVDFVPELAALVKHCVRTLADDRTTKKIEQETMRTTLHILEFLRDHRGPCEATEGGKEDFGLELLETKKQKHAASKNKIYQMICQAEKIVEARRAAAGGGGQATTSSNICQKIVLGDDEDATSAKKKRAATSDKEKETLPAVENEGDEEQASPPKKKKKLSGKKKL
ncbi:unnamed protein product [Amoebophrya sp. A25]|nr:unnamed protein product [Amoebophrya sp. A25]|eukprot:GSA25T00013163001.1